MMLLFFNIILQFATWDTAFQMLPFARLAPSFTKNQLLLFLGENYMKADGQVSYLCNFLNMTCITYHPNTPTNSNSYRTPLEKFSWSAHVDDHFQTRRSKTCICHILCLFSDVYTCSYFSVLVVFLPDARLWVGHGPTLSSGVCMVMLSCLFPHRTHRHWVLAALLPEITAEF